MSEEQIKLAFEAIYAALNEITQTLNYQPEIPHNHKKDVCDKLHSVRVQIKAMRNGFTQS